MHRGHHFLSRLTMHLFYIVLLFFLMTVNIYAQEIPVYREDFDNGEADGWHLDPNWGIDSGMLFSNGSGLVYYRERRWGDQPFVLEFSLKYLSLGEGMDINVHLDNWRRYAIRLSYSEADGPAPTRALTIQLGKYISRYDSQYSDSRELQIYPRIGHRLRIKSQEGKIEVQLDGEDVLQYNDYDPLGPGFIGFESLEGTSVQLDDVEISLLPVVSPPPDEPRLSLKVYPKTAEPNSSVTFTATLEYYNGDIGEVQYLFDFGDGKSHKESHRSSESRVSHRYRGTGEYTARVEAVINREFRLQSEPVRVVIEEQRGSGSTDHFDKYKRPLIYLIILGIGVVIISLVVRAIIRPRVSVQIRQDAGRRMIQTRGNLISEERREHE